MEHVRKINTVLTDNDTEQEQQPETKQKSKSLLPNNLSKRANFIKLVVICAAIVIIALIVIYYISKQRKKNAIKECTKNEMNESPLHKYSYTDEQVETFLKNSKDNMTNFKEEIDRKNLEIANLKSTMNKMKNKKNSHIKMTLDSDNDSDDDTDDTNDTEEDFTDNDDSDDSDNDSKTKSNKDKKNKKSEQNKKASSKESEPMIKREKRTGPLPGRQINPEFNIANTHNNNNDTTTNTTSDNDEKENKELAAILADDGHLDTKENENRDD